MAADDRVSEGEAPGFGVLRLPSEADIAEMPDAAREEEFGGGNPDGAVVNIIPEVAHAGADVEDMDLRLQPRLPDQPPERRGTVWMSGEKIDLQVADERFQLVLPARLGNIDEERRKAVVDRRFAEEADDALAMRFDIGRPEEDGGFALWGEGLHGGDCSM